MSQPTIILQPEQVKQKIRRLAFQIWEANFDEKRILLAGVKNRGLQLAELLAADLHGILQCPQGFPKSVDVAAAVFRDGALPALDS